MITDKYMKNTDVRHAYEFGSYSDGMLCCPDSLDKPYSKVSQLYLSISSNRSALPIMWEVASGRTARGRTIASATGC